MAERSEAKSAKRSFASKIKIQIFWREASLRAFRFALFSQFQQRRKIFIACKSSQIILFMLEKNSDSITPAWEHKLSRKVFAAVRTTPKAGLQLFTNNGRWDVSEGFPVSSKFVLLCEQKIVTGLIGV